MQSGMASTSSPIQSNPQSTSKSPQPARNKKPSGVGLRPQKQKQQPNEHPVATPIQIVITPIADDVQGKPAAVISEWASVTVNRQSERDSQTNSAATCAMNSAVHRKSRAEPLAR